MAKERPLPDVAEQNDELTLIDEELDKALDSLRAANDRVLGLLDHIEGVSRTDDPDGDGAPGKTRLVPGETDTEDADDLPSHETAGPREE